MTWGQTEKPNGHIVTKRGHKTWDAGERSVIEGLAEFDLADVFRSLYGYEVQEFSWYFRRKGETISKRRFDHIFASRKLNPVKCCYVHALREQGLSDHSAIEVCFEPSGQPLAAD